MNIRCTAALTLAVWYLVVPNPKPKTGKPDVNAPLSQWGKFKMFSGPDECEKVKSGLLRLLEDPSKMTDPRAAALVKEAGPQGLRESREMLTASKCVDGDDPRLK